MVIRHGEKEEAPAARHCINELGDPDDDGLSVRGWQRAGALVALFGSEPRAREFGLTVPEKLYACAVAPQHLSKRSVLTLDPLAQRLGLALNTGFTKGDEAVLADFLSTTKESALICWEHKMIPALCRAFDTRTSRIPIDWPDERYDVVWLFERRAYGREVPWTFSQVPQMLLAGDRSDGIGVG